MPFIYRGIPVGVKAYDRKDGTRGAMVKFCEQTADGDAVFYQFSLPPELGTHDFPVGKEVEFPVVVGGRDAYYKVSGRPAAVGK